MIIKMVNVLVKQDAVINLRAKISATLATMLANLVVVQKKVVKRHQRTIRTMAATSKSRQSLLAKASHVQVTRLAAMEMANNAAVNHSRALANSARS